MRKIVASFTLFDQWSSMFVGEDKYDRIIHQLNSLIRDENQQYLKEIHEQSLTMQDALFQSLNSIPEDVLDKIKTFLKGEKVSVSVPFCGGNVEWKKIAKWVQYLAGGTDRSVRVFSSDCDDFRYVETKPEKRTRGDVSLDFTRIDLSKVVITKTNLVFIGHPNLFEGGGLSFKWDQILKNSHHHQTCSVAVTYLPCERDAMVAWYKVNDWQVAHNKENPFAVNFPGNERFSHYLSWAKTKKISYDPTMFDPCLGKRYRFLMVAFKSIPTR